MDLTRLIRDVPDFPSAGITFKDITPLLAEPDALAHVVERMAEPFSGTDRPIDMVVGIEARGFILASPIATRLGAGFVPLRKAGKLPAVTLEATYELEYGTATLEVHADAFDDGDRVLIVDDVLATGGTAAAAVELVNRAGGEVVGLSFLIELAFLDGAEALKGLRRAALVTIE